MMSARGLRRAAADTRGAEVLEFALVFPVVLLVLAGIADMGLLFNNYEVVTNAAREGARVAALPGWTEDEVEERVLQYASAGGLNQGNVSTAVNPDLLAIGGHNVQSVTVVVSYPYNYIVLGAVANIFQGEPLGAGVTLTAAATMRKELAAGL
jgi:Flp pilus assembly protein TadG